MKDDKTEFLKLSLSFVIGDLILLILPLFIKSLRTTEFAILMIFCIGYSVWNITDLFYFYKDINPNFMKSKNKR